jgi:UDP-glucuronate decarboxylase
MIRWITNNLGTAAFETIRSSDDCLVIDVRDMVDKGGNLPETVQEKIEEGTVGLAAGRRVVVCCDYGFSRSNAVAAGIIAFAHKKSLEESVKEVLATTSEKNIKIEVLATVREALEKMGYLEKKDDISTRTALVTGGTSFIGSLLIERLKAKIGVIPISSRDVDLLTDTVVLDLMVKENSVTDIIHLAHPRVYTTNRALGESLTMMRNVLDVCKENNLRIVYLSGWEIYSGYRSSYLLASENLAAFPKGGYGESKWLCEKLLGQYENNYDLRNCLVRSGPLYGVGADKPKFFFNFADKASRNQTVYAHRYLNGFPCLDLLHIDDFLEVFVPIIAGDFTGCLHVGGGKGWSTTEIAEIIIHLQESRSTIEHRLISDYCTNIIMDIRKVSRIFQWKPKISLEEGIEQILKQRILKNEN